MSITIKGNINAAMVNLGNTVIAGDVVIDENGVTGDNVVIAGNSVNVDGEKEPNKVVVGNISGSNIVIGGSIFVNGEKLW